MTRSCIDCDWLGEHVFGADIDTVFAYPTPKFVNIHDRTLGLLKLVLMSTIFVYIFGYQIWYKGEHFERNEVDGTYRLQWQQPTVNGCNPNQIDCDSNFTSLDRLPYCSQYAGKEASAVNRTCEFYDAVELPVNLPGGVLIPTYVATFEQSKLCPSGSVTCKRKFQYLDGNGLPQEGPGDASPTQAGFVANAEDFTILIDHAIRSGKMAYDDWYMQGYWSMCDRDGSICTTRLIKCVRSDCDSMGLIPVEMSLNKSETPASSLVASARDRPQLGSRHKLRVARSQMGSVASWLGVLSGFVEGADSEIAEPSETEQAAARARDQVVSVDAGDVLSLKTLLAMAGRSLDETFGDENNRLETLRLRGTALVLKIEYHNMVPWTLFKQPDPPSYTISVTSQPSIKFKHTYSSQDTAAGRQLKVAYGIDIIVIQSGEIASFNMAHSLVMLTAAMGLLAVSNTFTDMLALYVLPKKEIYRELKYQESGDLNPGGRADKSDK